MSVTQILKHVFPRKYAGVPQKVLDAAKDRGNEIHEKIERFAMSHSDDDRYDLIFSGINYETLESAHSIIITSCEKILVYLDEGKPLYAGKYDLHGTMENQTALFDIKATSKYDEEYLRWQLSLYALAYRQMYGRTVERLGAFWYPKNRQGKFFELYRYGEDFLLEEVRKIVKEHHAR